MSIPLGIDLDQEREASLDRHRKRIAPELLDFRAEQVLERASPATSRQHLERAAERLYRRQPDEVRREIVERAVQLAANPNRPGRPGRKRKTDDALRALPRKAPLRAKPRKVKTLKSIEPVAKIVKKTAPPTKEASVATQPKRKSRDSMSHHPARGPIREIAQPMLEKDPQTTPAEVEDAVVAAGIEVPHRTAWYRIWRELLRDMGLDTPELKRARASRSQVIRQKRRRATAEPKEAAPVPAPAPTPVVVQASDGSKPPVPTLELPAGVHLLEEGESQLRIVVDVSVEGERAYEAIGHIARWVGYARGMASC